MVLEGKAVKIVNRQGKAAREREVAIFLAMAESTGLKVLALLYILGSLQGCHFPSLGNLPLAGGNRGNLGWQTGALTGHPGSRRCTLAGYAGRMRGSSRGAAHESTDPSCARRSMDIHRAGG